MLSEQDISRFKTFIGDPIWPRDCWPWLGHVFNGRGTFHVDGIRRPFKAPRVSYEIFIGPISNNICHDCDNTICVNPDHLFDGTQLDNVRDMISKGRNVLYHDIQRHCNRIITEQQAVEILALFIDGLSVVEIAAKFDFTYWIVYNLIKGRTWKHLKRPQ